MEQERPQNRETQDLEERKRLVWVQIAEKGFI